MNLTIRSAVLVLALGTVSLQTDAQKKIQCPDGEHIEIDVSRISIQYQGSSFAETLNGLGALGARMQVEPKRLQEAAEATQQWDVFLKGLAEGYNKCAISRQQYAEGLNRIYPRLKEDAADLEEVRKGISKGQRIEMKRIQGLLDSYYANLERFAHISGQEVVLERIETLSEQVRIGQDQLKEGQTRLFDQQRTDTEKTLAKLSDLETRTVTPAAQSTQPEHSADWRTIADWQKVKLAAVAVQYPHNTLHIIASSLSDETWNYANQFKEVFSRAGWKVIGPETAPLDQAAINIQLSISESYWGLTRPEAFTAIDSMLKFIGIKKTPNFVVDPLVNPDELLIWVGAQGPPNLPQGVPLQLGTICRHPMKFADATVHFLDDPTALARLVTIQPPGSRFIAGQKFLVLLTDVAKSVGTSDSFQVQALGKVMPRADTLDISVSRNLSEDEPIRMTIISDREIQIRCVENRSPL